MRAVAVLLVIVFHAGLPLKGGFVGVDVFFVISGFLITGLLVRELEERGTVDLLQFYARRARRLIPVAACVLVVAAVLTWRFAPITSRSVFGLDVVSAGAFVLNWRLAARAVDYLASDVGRSPVLHFWSLSVEEQFYFLWPPLIWGSVEWARRMRWSPRRALAAALGVVVSFSFAWSVAFTSVDRLEAFFVTSTRLWELGLGGLLELVRPRLAKVPARAAAPLALSGALFVGLSAWFARADRDWPGSNALGPTLGASLLIAAGAIHPKNSVTRMLASPPLVWVGGLSYSLYLWHWPILLVAHDWLGLHGPRWGIGLALASGVPAWLGYRLIECPIRFSSELTKQPKLALSVGISLSLAAACAALFLDVRDASVPSIDANAGATKGGPHPLGAAVLGKRPRESAAGAARASYATIVPPPARANSDLSRAHYRNCQVPAFERTPRWCDMGDLDATYRIAVVGDSKITQYADALEDIAKTFGWRLSMATKAQCPFADALAPESGDREHCKAFDAAVLEELRRHPPDAVVTSQGSKRGFSAAEPTVLTEQIMIDGLARRWSELGSWGTRVVVVLDNPFPSDFGPVYECVLKNPSAADRCAFDRDAGIESSAALTERAAAAASGATVIDLTDYICPQDRCAPVIGDVLLYRQGTHLTNTYARSLTPVLARKLAAALSE